MTTPQDLLDDCRQLLHVVHSDARRRTIISRAYYAAYHFLFAHPCTRPYVPRTDVGMHRAFHEFLQNSTDRNVQYAASILCAMYVLRIQADYRIQAIMPRNVERNCVEDAAEIIEEIFA